MCESVCESVCETVCESVARERLCLPVCEGVCEHTSSFFSFFLGIRSFCSLPCAAFWWVKSVTGSNAGLAGRGCVR